VRRARGLRSRCGRAPVSPPALAVRSTLRVAAVLLLLAGALTAAYSVQVV